VDAFGRFKKAFGSALNVAESIANPSQKNPTDQKLKA